MSFYSGLGLFIRVAVTALVLYWCAAILLRFTVEAPRLKCPDTKGWKWTALKTLIWGATVLGCVWLVSCVWECLRVLALHQT